MLKNIAMNMIDIFGQDRSPSISWPRAAVPTDVIAKVFDFFGTLLEESFGFLQTDDIRIE